MPLRYSARLVARPFRIGLRQQRQVEQPFAGIVDETDRDMGRSAADFREKFSGSVGRHEADFDPDFPQIVGAMGPDRGSGRHRLHVFLIAESRQPARAGGFDPDAAQAPVFRRLSSGMRSGVWTALRRLWIRLVMNTVLPDRLRPVTARLTVEPWARSARLEISDSQPDALASNGLSHGKFGSGGMLGIGKEPRACSAEYRRSPAEWK